METRQNVLLRRVETGNLVMRKMRERRVGKRRRGERKGGKGREGERREEKEEKRIYLNLLKMREDQRFPTRKTCFLRILGRHAQSKQAKPPPEILA